MNRTDSIRFVDDRHRGKYARSRAPIWSLAGFIDIGRPWAERRDISCTYVQVCGLRFVVRVNWRANLSEYACMDVCMCAEKRANALPIHSTRSQKISLSGCRYKERKISLKPPVFEGGGSLSVNPIASDFIEILEIGWESTPPTIHATLWRDSRGNGRGPTVKRWVNPFFKHYISQKNLSILDRFFRKAARNVRRR